MAHRPIRSIRRYHRVVDQKAIPIEASLNLDIYRNAINIGELVSYKSFSERFKISYSESLKIINCLLYQEALKYYDKSDKGESLFIRISPERF